MLKLKRLLSVALLCLTACTATPTPAQPTAPPVDEQAVTSGTLKAKLDEYLQRLNKLGFSGAVLVTRGAETILAHGYSTTSEPITLDTVFAIGSNSKPFTAAAVLKLQDAGKLRVTDTLEKFFPEAPSDKRAITLHQLLTHSSGLSHSGHFTSDFENVSRTEAVRRLLASELLFAPGQASEYSDAGYILLAAIVEQVSGQTFQEYVRAELLIPAQMKRTGWWGQAIPVPGTADFPEPSWAILGAGGMISSVADLQRWHTAVQSGAVVSAEAVKAYASVQFPADERGGEGYGWAVFEAAPGRRVRSSAGGTPQLGHNNVMTWWMDDDVLFIASSSSPEWRAEAVVPYLRAIVFGQEYQLPPEGTTLTAEVLQARAGRFQLSSGGVLEVKVDGQGLAVSGEGQEAFELLFAAPPEAAKAQAALESFLKKNTDPELTLLERFKTKKAETLGAFKEQRIVGALPLGGGDLWVFMVHEFEQGRVYTRWAFGPQGGLLGAVYDVEPPTLKFYPQTENQFVTFDLLNPAPPLTLAFSVDGKELTLTARETSLTATRQ
jgi:CubicO group peptidase (beta-lactamase class C family)